AGNNEEHGDRKLQLNIDRLNAEDPKVSYIHTPAGKRLKCEGNGVFQNPWVRWYLNSTDLSVYGSRNITHLPNGMKRVESVLDHDVEQNRHYICQIREGKLKRSVRAVISDGEHSVSVPKIELPE
ncbi:uncharacterized protein PAF06_004945, partial [Gastrophryne carolinensis]